MASGKVWGVIPARFSSTRYPGKPLASICGKSMVQRVYEQSARAGLLDELGVATDDERIRAEVTRFGGRCWMTAGHHPSGTDRLAEVAEQLEASVIVNIQGDQPFIAPEMIDEVVAPMLEDEALPMATLMCPIENPEDYDAPGVVKTVTTLSGDALYFSRSRIPHPHNDFPHSLYEHVGLYAYRRDFLLKLSSLEPTPLEQIEGLEQLRVLEHGYRLRVVETRYGSSALGGFSIDTPEDLARGESMLRERGLD